MEVMRLSVTRSRLEPDIWVPVNLAADIWTVPARCAMGGICAALLHRSSLLLASYTCFPLYINTECVSDKARRNFGVLSYAHELL